MKKIFVSIAAVLFMVTLFAQAPQKMSYQAVIRDGSSNLVKGLPVGMRISILQGSVSGTVVYTETQTPATNANGLVSIEIGGGTGFGTIDWANGPYFIKTETDPTGGTSYSITGTSQLLSVPYALHAKTVESYPETDPVFGGWNKSSGISITASQVSDFQSSVTNNAAVLLNTAKVSNATHTGDVTGSGVLTIANKVTMTGTAPVSITGSPSVIASGSVDISIAAATTSTSGSMSAADKTKLDGIPISSYYLGQEKDGGIIFYIYKGSDGLEHGLIVSKTETTASWGGSTLVGADRTEDGAYNMNLMTTDEGTARAWIEGLGAGWYLPSIDELSLLWHSRYHVNKTARAISSTLLSTAAPYWSSTEYNDNSSFFFYFFWGYQANAAKSDASYFVRAIRAF
jgi:hypothetical protein